MCSSQDLWRLLSETSKVQADYTELFDQESEIGFNKAKAVWDRQRVLEAKGAAIFQRRLLAGLRAEQPVKKLLAEVRDARRHPALFQTVVRSASAAKAISDFADQELTRSTWPRRLSAGPPAVLWRRGASSLPGGFCGVICAAAYKGAPGDQRTARRPSLMARRR